MRINCKRIHRKADKADIWDIGRHGEGWNFSELFQIRFFFMKNRRAEILGVESIRQGEGRAGSLESSISAGIYLRRQKFIADVFSNLK